MRPDVEPREIARSLAGRIHQLVADLLPNGHREGRHEWRCGSVAGEAGGSLGVHLTDGKAGVWSDFSTGQKGDALDLVRAVLDVGMPEALNWSCRWLGLEDGKARMPPRPASPPPLSEPPPGPERWRLPWSKAVPIAGTLGETYLAGRGLRFDDRAGDVLRFAPRRARQNPAGKLERHPALLAVLRDVRTGEPCGLINVYLRPDGSDRLRDKKGKTTTGRASGAAVMFDDFADVTMGLTICEGAETGIALRMSEQRPAWALGGAGNLGIFPVLAGIEALTIAADADEPGRKAAQACAARWREAGREAVMIAPPVSGTDWADGRR